MHGTRPLGLLLIFAGMVGGFGFSRAAVAETPIAFVVNVSGGGARIGEDSETIRPDSAFHAASPLGVMSGESVTTMEEGSAVVVLPGFDTVVLIEASSEVRFEALNTNRNMVPVATSVLRGRAQVLRREIGTYWILVGAKNEFNEGYVLSDKASIVVTVESEDISFSAMNDDMYAYIGTPPPGPYFFLGGKPKVKPDAVFSKGQSVRLRDLGGPVEDSSIGQDGQVDALRNVELFGLVDGEIVFDTLAMATPLVANRGMQNSITPTYTSPTGDGGRILGESLIDDSRRRLVQPGMGAVPGSGSQTPSRVGRIERARIIGNPGTRHR